MLPSGCVSTRRSVADAPVREDGHELWLRYRPVTDTARLREYRAAITQLVVAGDSPTMAAAREELSIGLRGLLDAPVPIDAAPTREGAVLVGSQARLPFGVQQHLSVWLETIESPEGFLVVNIPVGGQRTLVIAGKSDVGALYGAFWLLRRLQTHAPLRDLMLTE